MATTNFDRMDCGMPLVVGGCDNWYVNENGNFDADAYDFWGVEDYRAAEKLAEEMTDKCEFHKITIKCGYYEAFQFVVESEYYDNGNYDIWNEDAHYYFDMCRSKAIRKMESENKRIRKWLMNLCKNDVYECYELEAVVSNGEGYYKRVA